MHGFHVVRERNLDDCDGILYEMVHEKTGAQLCWISNKDRNKTFAVSFKTIPQDDTGVFHILEHSVLNGSEKYPAREPFVELLKSSLQTFLNAFTYPDKTMYPVASRNDKDFMNLMSVYMDAVFHPSIYTNPNIFYQEGWHYEIRNREDDPVYKGVVLNEMKGAFSSVDEMIIDEFNRILFPDNCYRFVSGGDPKHITDLSYEDFIATHQKFYHPSNARVFLEGDMDIDKVLAFIDDEYFSRYEKEDMDFSIPMQKVTDGGLHKNTYEISPEEDMQDKTQISLARIVTGFSDLEKILAWHILANVLTANNESPLKKAILDRGLGQDLELDIYDNVQQPWVVLTVRNTNEEAYDEIRSVLRETGRKMAEEGLDHDEIGAELNQVEFRYRERHEPAGVMHAQRIMESWLYDGDPALYLSMGGLFDILRNKLEEGYFEKLLEEFLLDEEHLHALITVPSVTLAQERLNEENEKLQKAKASWGNEIDAYIEKNRILDEWQAQPDSQEVIDRLPKLSISDIRTTIEDYPCNEKKFYGVPVLEYEAEKSGIVYLNMYFSLAGITRDRLPAVGTFAGLMTELPTEDHGVQELQSLISRYVGALNFYTEVFTPDGDRERCLPMFGVSCSVLEKNLTKAADLIIEILQKTVFDKEAILPLIRQDNEEFRQALIMNGHSFAMRRAAAHFSCESLFREYTVGYEAGMFEKELESHYEEKIDALLAEFDLIREVIFSPARLTIGITGSHDEVIDDMIGRLNYVDAQRAVVHYPLLENKKEAMQIPAGISYSACAGNFEKHGYEYDYRMAVLSHILTYDYLWSEVRVKGGAYGTGFSINPNANCGAYSYRDPDPLNAVRIFSETPAYIRSLKDLGDQIETFVIGTMSSADPLLSPSTKVKLADSRYFRNKTYEDRLEAIRTILSVKAEDLASYGDAVEKALSDCAVCIVGPKEVTDSLEGYTVLPQL